MLVLMGFWTETARTTEEMPLIDATETYRNRKRFTELKFMYEW